MWSMWAMGYLRGRRLQQCVAPDLPDPCAVESSPDLRRLKERLIEAAKCLFRGCQGTLPGEFRAQGKQHGVSARIVHSLVIKYHQNSSKYQWYLDPIRIQLGYPLIHPIFGTQGLQCDLPRALRPGHSVLSCFLIENCVFSLLMSTQIPTEPKACRISRSATDVFASEVGDYVVASHWLIDPSSDFLHCPQNRWIPEVVMRTTSNPTPRWRPDETWMIKEL